MAYKNGSRTNKNNWDTVQLSFDFTQPSLYREPSEIRSVPAVNVPFRGNVVKLSANHRWRKKVEKAYDALYESAKTLPW